MRRIKLLQMWVFMTLVVILALGISKIALAGDSPPPPPSQHPDMPQCIDMPNAQVPGTKPGTACRIPVTVQADSGNVDSKVDSIGILLSYGRTGSTSHYNSTTNSGLIENEIKVEGYLWMRWPNVQRWYIEDTCEQSHTNSSSAACRTYGGTSGYQLGQQGYHYWINSTYGNDSLETWDTWWA